SELSSQSAFLRTTDNGYGLIMHSALANMDHRMALAEDTARGDLGDDEVMVAGGAAAGDFARQIREGLIKDRPVALAAQHLQTGERSLIQLEAAAEMHDHVGLRFVENIQRERGTRRQECGDRPLALHGEADLRGANEHCCTQ